MFRNDDDDDDDDDGGGDDDDDDDGDDDYYDDDDVEVGRYRAMPPYRVRHRLNQWHFKRFCRRALVRFGVSAVDVEVVKRTNAETMTGEKRRTRTRYSRIARVSFWPGSTRRR